MNDFELTVPDLYYNKYLIKTKRKSGSRLLDLSDLLFELNH